MYKRKIKLDIGTYGGTPAAHLLVNIINEKQLDGYNKIGKLLNTFKSNLNELSKLNTNTSISIVNVLYHDALQRADKCPEEISTLVKNLIVGYYRSWSKDADAQTPKKNRLK